MLLQSHGPFERWLDSMTKFWRFSGPLEIQNHYHTLPCFQTRRHPCYAPFMFPSPLLFKSYPSSNYPTSGWDKGLRVSSHQASAELTVEVRTYLGPLDLDSFVHIHTLPDDPTLATPSNCPKQTPRQKHNSVNI